MGSHSYVTAFEATYFSFDSFVDVKWENFSPALIENEGGTSKKVKQERRED
jgi:hypothetical protein